MEGSKSKYKDSLDDLNAQILEIEHLLNDKYGACEVKVVLGGYALWWTQGKERSDPWVIRVSLDERLKSEAEDDYPDKWHLISAPAQYRAESAVFIPDLVEALQIKIDTRIQGIESVTDLLKQLCVDLILE